MAWLDDFSFDVATGNVRHVSGTTRYPVIDMHRGLQALAYQSTKSGDDLLDITDLFVPSKRNSDTDIELLDTVNVDADAVEYMYGGSITYGTGDDVYSGLAIAGGFNANALPQVIQDNTKLTSYWGFSFSPDTGLGYAVRILVKSKTGGTEIDGGRVRAQSRGYTYQYREGSTVLGRNESVAAVGTIASDTFNTVAEGTISGYTDIVNTEGFQQIDYNNDNGPQDYYMSWTKDTRAKTDVYNRIKYETRDGTAETLYGLNGELFRGITHEIDITPGTGTWVEPEEVSWATGTGQLLAIDDTDGTATTKMWLQLLTGVAPVTDLITGAGAATGTANNVTVVARGVESVAGNFTGSWITSYGVGMAIADVGNTDTLKDLTGAPQSPPNNQNVTASGLVSGEDQIIIGKSIDAGATIDKTEYSGTAANTSGAGTITVNEAITNVPAAGWVRIDNGVGDDRYPYSSFSGSVFTLDAVTLSTTYADSADVYPTILDKTAGSALESNTWVYTGDTDIAGQVLDSGGTPTKAFPISGTFKATGFSVSVVRTPDV
jgi:hypothetical protein